jgi:hypothetical protein
VWRYNASRLTLMPEREPPTFAGCSPAPQPCQWPSAAWPTVDANTGGRYRAESARRVNSSCATT